MADIAQESQFINQKLEGDDKVIINTRHSILVFMERRKVSKTLTSRYDILSDVIASPTRIEIIDKLSDYPAGLPYEEIVKRIPEDLLEMNVQRHFNQLVKKNVIEYEGNGKYALSELGKETYKVLVNVASRAKSEQIFSNV